MVSLDTSQDSEAYFDPSQNINFPFWVLAGAPQFWRNVCKTKVSQKWGFHKIIRTPACSIKLKYASQLFSAKWRDATVRKNRILTIDVPRGWSWSFYGPRQFCRGKKLTHAGNGTEWLRYKRYQKVWVIYPLLNWELPYCTHKPSIKLGSTT